MPPELWKSVHDDFVSYVNRTYPSLEVFVSGPDGVPMWLVNAKPFDPRTTLHNQIELEKRNIMHEEYRAVVPTTDEVIGRVRLAVPSDQPKCATQFFLLRKH